MPAFTQRLRSFRDDESGSMVLFAIYLFSAILLLGGLSLTVIAHEATRLRLQNTIDMAVLAAADLNQSLDPEEVVNDYFEKAGLIENLKRVEVTESLNSREVLAEAEMSVDTMLLNSLTSDSWLVSSVGAAREDISNIEVSMVLDASGSMGSQGRMSALKTAAKDFVDDILLVDTEGAQNGEVSISVVPYSTQVSMPQAVLDELSLDHRHAYSGCVDFTQSDFTTTALPSGSRSQTAHFDVSSTAQTPSRWVCNPNAAYEATLFSQDAPALRSAIDAMQPYEWTSIDLGVKWGAALLDPSSQGIVDSLIADNVVDDAFSGRPFSFTTANQMKVLVVMTDGENTNQYQLDDHVASGPSDVWEHNDDYSVWVPLGDEHSSLGLGPLRDVQPTKWKGNKKKKNKSNNNSCNSSSGWNCGGGGTKNGDDDDDWNTQDNTDQVTNDGIVDDDGNVYENFFHVDNHSWDVLPDGGFSAERVDWQEIWANFTVYHHADEFRYDQQYHYDDYEAWYWDLFTTIGATEKDQRMADICSAAKDAGIIVFTIGFLISDTNAAKMRDCASSDNHYFDVDNNTIDLAFAAIANSINQLRLVQ